MFSSFFHASLCHFLSPYYRILLLVVDSITLTMCGSYLWLAAVSLSTGAFSLALDSQFSTNKHETLLSVPKESAWGAPGGVKSGRLSPRPINRIDHIDSPRWEDLRQLWG